MIQKSKPRNGFIVNNLLLISGIAMIISGLVLQIGFHMGSAPGNHERRMHSQAANFVQVREINPGKTHWGMGYKTWTITHKTAIVCFSLLMVYHFAIHWKWYKGVFTKHLIVKNKQVIILLIFFLLVALTGFVSWFIDLSGSKSIIRMAFMEIHDKLALFLTACLILHVAQRVNWFSKTFEKLYSG